MNKEVKKRRKLRKHSLAESSITNIVSDGEKVENERKEQVARAWALTQTKIWHERLKDLTCRQSRFVHWSTRMFWRLRNAYNV